MERPLSSLFFFFLPLFQLTYGYHSRDSTECCKKRLATGRELVVRADTIGLENVDEIERRSSITHVLVRQSVVKTNYSVLRYSRKGERRGGSFKCTALFSASRIERYFPEVERHARKKRANLLLVLKPYGIYRNIRLVNKAKPHPPIVGFIRYVRSTFLLWTHFPKHWERGLISFGASEASN